MNQTDTESRAAQVDSNDASDEELIRLAQMGSLDAFTGLYERYLALVFNRVRYRIPESDVEDVTQEVFIAVMKSLKSFQGKSKFSAWLRTLTNRKVADYYRRRNRDQSDMSSEFDEEALQAANPKSITAPPMSDDQIILRQAMQTLPEHYQDILLLRFAEGLRFNEIAQLQGKTLESTKSLYRRAIASIRKQLEDSND